MPESLPPIPPDGSQLDYLVRAVTWLTVESISHTEKLEAIMAQNDDFSAALSRAEGATTTALSGIARQIQQLADELATDRAPTQAQIDRLNAVAASLEDASVRLAADDPTAPTP